MLVEVHWSECARPDGSSCPILFSEYSSSALSFTKLFCSDRNDLPLPLMKFIHRPKEWVANKAILRNRFVDGGGLWVGQDTVIFIYTTLTFICTSRCLLKNSKATKHVNLKLCMYTISDNGIHVGYLNFTSEIAQIFNYCYFLFSTLVSEANISLNVQTQSRDILSHD